MKQKPVYLGVWCLVLGLLLSGCAATNKQLFESAKVQYEKGNLDEAISQYNDILQKRPLNNLDKAIIYCARGIAWVDKGQLDKALSDLDYSISLATMNYAEPFLIRGGIHYKRAVASSAQSEKRLSIEKAILDLERFISKFPGVPAMTSESLTIARDGLIKIKNEQKELLVYDGKEPTTVVTSSAQTTPPAQDKASKVKVLDSSITTLPKGFKGDDIATIFQEATKVDFIKGEFETTPQYESRIASQVSYLEGRQFSVLWSIDRIKPPYVFNLIKTSYNADMESMRIDMSTTPPCYPKTSLDGFIFQRKTINRSHFVGTNAFGVKVNATKIEHLEYFVSTWQKRIFPIFIKANSEEARHYKESAALLFFFKLVEQKGTTFYDCINHSKATIDLPVEMVSRRKGIKVIVEEIWVVNSKTGKVHHKQIY